MGGNEEGGANNPEEKLITLIQNEEPDMLRTAIREMGVSEALRESGRVQEAVRGRIKSLGKNGASNVGNDCAYLRRTFRIGDL